MIDQNSIRKKLPAAKRIADGTHAGLWLDKYIKGQSQNDPGNRSTLVQDVAELPEPIEYKGYFERWQAMLNEHEFRAQTRRVQVKGRMIVGLGSESVLETSICLHRTYGVPYIPGSALKGLAASYTPLYLGKEDKQWEKGGVYYNVIFGNTDDAGCITFLDALYIPGTGYKKKVLYPDVITVHHAEYYQGQRDAVPSDRDDPNPISFLSATGTYLLALAAPDLQQPTRWIEITFRILAEALDKLGIGAKTSSGYGRMKFLDPPIKPKDPEVKRAEDLKREIAALKNVAGEIPGYYQKWQRLASDEARKILALAIIERVRQSGREKVTAEKAWYVELQRFVGQ